MKPVFARIPAQLGMGVAALLLACLVVAPGLSAQSRGDGGLTGDPLVDSILQAPGPRFLERRGRQPATPPSQEWEPAPRQRRADPPPARQPARPAEDWQQREPEPQVTRRARREPPPPPAQRGQGPLDIVILDSEPDAPEQTTDAAQLPSSPDVPPPASEAVAQQSSDPEAVAENPDQPEAPFREQAQTTEAAEAPAPDAPGQVAVTSPAARNANQAGKQPDPGTALNKMIGQMVLVGFPGQTPSDDGVRRIAEQIENGQVGGVILMSGNIESPDQVKTLTRFLAKAGEDQPTPFIAVDQEGGYVQRLSRTKGFKTHPSAERLGDRNNPQGAYSAYRNLALELRAHGFNVNLGPVVDLNINPNNPIIGRLKRSYGKNPDHVTAFAKAFVLAHNDTGILTAAKHFPGHGSSDTDSHDVLVDVSASWQEAELRPYRKLIEADAIDMIMVGHLYHPAFSQDRDTPVSLSAKGIQRVLRDSMNYDGVVMTDDLGMRGVRQNTSFEERIVGAVAAGNDIILNTNGPDYDPDLPKRIADVLRSAVAEGKLSEERIRASYDRILALKDKLERLRKTASSAGDAPGLTDRMSGG